MLFISKVFKKLVFILFFKTFIFSQVQSKIKSFDLFQDDEGIEISIILDTAIDRDDIAAFIDRGRSFTLSIFNSVLDVNKDLNLELEYPLLSINHIESDEFMKIIFSSSRKFKSYSLLRSLKGKQFNIAIEYVDFEEVNVKDDVNLVQSFIVEDLLDSTSVFKKRIPSSWKEDRRRSSIRILCDTEGLPIYVDNQFVGDSPLEYAIDVLPGWHQVGYFPTNPSLTPEPKSPKDKMMDNILRMGILDIFVEEGKEQEIVLNYQNLDNDVLAYQKSIVTSSWVGFSLFFLLIVIISWGVG